MTGLVAENQYFKYNNGMNHYKGEMAFTNSVYFM